jgi:hypothetical protein
MEPNTFCLFDTLREPVFDPLHGADFGGGVAIAEVGLFAHAPLLFPIRARIPTSTGAAVVRQQVGQDAFRGVGERQAEEHRPVPPAAC